MIPSARLYSITLTTIAMSDGDIAGYAIHHDGSCRTDEITCVGTWGDWQACCPNGSQCLGEGSAT